MKQVHLHQVHRRTSRRVSKNDSSTLQFQPSASHQVPGKSLLATTTCSWENTVHKQSPKVCVKTESLTPNPLPHQVPERENSLRSFEEYMGLPSGEIALEMRNTFITHVQINNERRQIKVNTYFTHSSSARSFYMCVRNKRICITEANPDNGAEEAGTQQSRRSFLNVCYYSTIDKNLPFRFLHFYCLVHKIFN